VTVWYFDLVACPAINILAHDCCPELYAQGSPPDSSIRASAINPTFVISILYFKICARNLLNIVRLVV
jgi:hypothetical protein